VAYYRRAMPRFVAVKALLLDGAIGDPRALTVRLQSPPPTWEPGPVPWRLQPTISGGGLFVDLGSHTIDLLDHLLGPITGASGTAISRDRRYPAEDLVAATFTFGTEIVGVGLWDFDAPAHRDEIEIVGSAGSLTFSTFGQEPLRLTTPTGLREIAAPYPSTVQLPLIQTVVDALTAQGDCPSTGRSALRTAVAVDAILADFRATSAPAH